MSSPLTPVILPSPSPVATPLISAASPSPNPSPNLNAPTAFTPTPSPSPNSTPTPLPSPELSPSERTIFSAINADPPTLPQALSPALETVAMISTPTNAEISERIGGLEGSFQKDFQQYLGIEPRSSVNREANSGNSEQRSSATSSNQTTSSGNSEQTTSSGNSEQRSSATSSGTPEQTANSGTPDDELSNVTNLSQQANAQYSLQETQVKLNRITETTRVKPALIYVFFAPPGGSNDFNSANLAAQTNRAARNNDSLEVILITGQTSPVRVQFPKTTRRQVLEVANNFRSEVTNFRNSKGYLNPAQQMHQWFIAPLEKELQKQGIDNLVFLMDTGLRSIPLAAMHDGEGFVVERYSVGLMPSLNLTEPTYNPLDGSQVLAMGATTFGNSGLNPLPSVSLELNTVSRLWEGSEFLNETFTLNNLIQQRQNRPFRMIHLATHGVFNPGDRSNSYIQLWDGRLRLDQLDQLNWGNPPVDLLVLSACQTALGDRDAELGFAGLAINAGVRSALASLWEVNDVATLGLMTKFYQQLQVASTKSEALRLAQLAMIRGEVRLEDGNLVIQDGRIPLTAELRSLGDLQLIHPYFWSAFTMVGNPW
ncbi:MAG: CHAT domain-containing protein [Coleofasciculaceae cyanobacterium SM2_1_6]|nr:CHAT domain-containing protein [Coleofasciculaceae cyanobacterium SM2_1_6]